jgi:hypothetical protein
MVRFVEVEGFEIFGEDDYRVADEEVREVRGEDGIHATVHELLLEVRVEYEVGVKIFISEAGVERDVGAVCCVAGFGDAPAGVFEGLETLEGRGKRAWTNLFSQFFRSSIVDCGADLIPPNVCIGEKSFVYRGGGC